MENNQKRIGAILSYLNIIINNLIVVLYVPILLRNLGQEEFGLYQMINSVIMTLSFLSLGFSSAYIPFYIKYKEIDDEKRMRSLNGMYLLLFLIMSLVSIIIGSVMLQNITSLTPGMVAESQMYLAEILMLFMIANIALTFPSSVFEANILAHERFKFNQICRLLMVVAKPMLVAPQILMGVNSVAIVITQTFMSLIFLLMNATFAIYKLKMRFDFTPFPFSLFKEVAIFSFFIALGQIVELVNNNVPNFIIGRMLGLREVTTYVMSIQIRNLFVQFSMTFSRVFVPEVNRIVVNSGKMSELTKLMIKVGRLQMIVLMFVFGGFITVGRFFISRWAGDENMLVYPLVIIMIPIALIPWCQNTGIEIQKAMNKHQFRSVVYLLFAAVNIALTYVFINTFGIIGAAISFAISIICGHGIIMNYYYWKIGINIKKFWMSLLNILVPFSISTSFTLFFQEWIKVDNFLLFLLFGIFYTALYMIIYFLYSINSDEKEMIRQMRYHFTRYLKIR